MVLKQDGSVWATGYNLYGQLGDGWAKDNYVFVQVISDGAIAVAAGGFHSMVLKQDDSIWVTGSNKYGQFGDGSTTSTKNFIKLTPFDNGANRDPIACVWHRNSVLLQFALHPSPHLFIYFLSFACSLAI